MTRHAFTGLVLCLAMLPTLAAAQDAGSFWGNQDSSAAPSNEVPNQDQRAEDMHSAYWSDRPANEDPRYDEDRRGWFDVPTPTSGRSHFWGDSQSDMSQVSGGSPLVIEDIGKKIIDVWNIFTGDSWWRGVGKVLGLAVTVRMAGMSGLLNSGLPLDREFLQRRPPQKERNTGKEPIDPKDFHDCGDCRFFVMSEDGDVGEVFRHSDQNFWSNER